MISAFYHPDDLQIMDLDQIYMTSSAYLQTGFKDVWATFDLVVRDMPKHRNFLIFAGLEEIVTSIMQWRYTKEHVRILKQQKLISNAFGDYLKRFKYSGDVHAMKEGSVFFPGEPIVRITAPIIEANLLSAFLLTAASSNIPYTSKFIRSILAAKGVSVVGTGPQRATSFEQAFKCERAAYIAGTREVPSPAVREKLGIESDDALTIAYHAFIKSYPTELEAMRAAAQNTKVDLSLMIDTYDLKKGLQNAITVIKEYQKKVSAFKIVIDSGDLLSRCRYARKELDKNGLRDVSVSVAGNLDEYKIVNLKKARIPASGFLVHTEAVAPTDDPKLEVVYKLSEIIRHGKSEYKMKLAYGKQSLPGRKQVYRIVRNGLDVKDVIGLEGEKLGTPLLKPMIRKGKQVYTLPHIKTVREFARREVQKLPLRYHEVLKEYTYPVEISSKLKMLCDQVRMQELRQYVDVK